MPPANDDSLIGHFYAAVLGRTSTPGWRIGAIILLAIGAHLLVRAIRAVSEGFVTRVHRSRFPLGSVVQRPKVITVHRLIMSGIIFALYFVAFGLILRELGIDLRAYLASASVIGLAISFGSQGLVQDVVIGLTLILLDAMDVGDMVEIVGSATVVGLVQEIGLRFTKIVNFYNQVVLIPNRTIANVSRFPQGGVDAYADVWIPAGADPSVVRATLGSLAGGMRRQFAEIILSEPVVVVPQQQPGTDWAYARVHFKIWPNQGYLIETTFRQEVLKAMRAFDPNYSDWQVPVTYRAGDAAPTPAG